jgi:hypothetical protein
MQGEGTERAEIDLLIRELTAKKRVPSTGTPAASQPTAPAAPAPVPAPRAAASADQPARRPGRRWTNVRLLMPPRRSPDLASRSAFDAAASLPHVADLTRFFTLPGPHTMARMWVGLGAAYGVSMTFWPYPKTYLWGMVLYLLCLGLALVASIWGARLSWDARLGASHTVALCTAVWAVTLVTVEALPLV